MESMDDEPMEIDFVNIVTQAPVPFIYIVADANIFLHFIHLLRNICDSSKYKKHLIFYFKIKLH